MKFKNNDYLCHRDCVKITSTLIILLLLRVVLYIQPSVKFTLSLGVEPFYTADLQSWKLNPYTLPALMRTKVFSLVRYTFESKSGSNVSQSDDSRHHNIS